MAKSGAERYFESVETELKAERAAVLGRLGRRVEEALAACTALESELKAGDEASMAAYRSARDRVVRAIDDLCFQREMIGLHEHSWVYRIYKLPPAL